MNWKTTAVLGVLAAAVLVAVLVLQPHKEDPDKLKVDLLAGWNVGGVDRITIQRPGEVEIVLERSARPGGVAWNIAKPKAYAANAFMVDEMLGSVFGQRNSSFLKPDHKDYNLKTFGLDQPQLTVTLEGGGKRTTIRYGAEAKLNPGVVWIQRDQDPNVYFATVEVLQAFQKDLYQLRNKRLAWYEPHRVTKVTISKRFTNATKKAIEYDTCEAVLRDKDPKGWFFESPEERLEDTQVGALVSGIPNIIAEDFLALGDKKDFGLVEPQLKVTIHATDGTYTFHVGDDVKGRQNRAYVWAEGSDEVAIVDRERYLNPLPSSRNALRSRHVIYWGEHQTKRIEVESRELGKIVLLPTVKKVDSGTVAMEEIVWRMEGQVEVDPARCTNYARYLYTLMLKDETSWIKKAEGDDLQTYKLDPPELSIKWVLDSGERTLLFGTQTTEDVVMKKSWHDELYWAPLEYIRQVRLMDLAFRKMKVYDTNPDSILGFWFEDNFSRQPTFWQVMREAKGSEWKFTDQNSLDKKYAVDPARAARLLAMANYMEAKAFVGKDEATRKQHELAEKPAYKLHIIVGRAQSDRKVLWISRNFGKVRNPVHYARFEDEPSVFWLNEEIMDLLLDGVDQRTRIDPGDHDH